MDGKLHRETQRISHVFSLWPVFRVVLMKVVWPFERQTNAHDLKRLRSGVVADNCDPVMGKCISFDNFGIIIQLCMTIVNQM